jgi:hypothetical protein
MKMGYGSKYLIPAMTPPGVTRLAFWNSLAEMGVLALKRRRAACSATCLAFTVETLCGLP